MTDDMIAIPFFFVFRTEIPTCCQENCCDILLEVVVVVAAAVAVAMASSAVADVR